LLAARHGRRRAGRSACLFLQCSAAFFPDLHARPARHAAARPVRQCHPVLPVLYPAQPGEPTMALKKRTSNPWLSRLHFLVRLLGLTGFVAACAGLAIAHTQGLLSSFDGAWQFAHDTALGQAEGPLLSVVAAWLVLGGAGALVLALLVEAAVILRMTAGRRSAFGFNAVVQIAVATVLLVGINVYSFFHHHRADLTRDHRFTLPEKLSDQLRQLRGDTTVFVVQRRP